MESADYTKACVSAMNEISQRALKYISNVTKPGHYKNGKVCGVEVEQVEWTPDPDGGRPAMKPTGKVEVIEADLVLLAMGFLKPEHPQFAENVFVAGDAASGASLVVRAIASGRKAATDIDSYLNK